MMDWRDGEAYTQNLPNNSLVHCRSDTRSKEGGRSKDVPLTDVITRHVKQVADFNKALEKRQLWREREKELRSKHTNTWGILKDEGRSLGSSHDSNIYSRNVKRVLDSVVVEGVDKEVVEQVKEKVARTFGSLDAHAAIRQSTAKEKERRQLQRQNEVSDAWMPDRFYTEELKQKTPWLNPVEFLNELHPQRHDESLTPVASDSDAHSKRTKKSKKKKGKKSRKEKEKKRKKSTKD